MRQRSSVWDDGPVLSTFQVGPNTNAEAGGSMLQDDESRNLLKRVSEEHDEEKLQALVGQAAERLAKLIKHERTIPAMREMQEGVEWDETWVLKAFKVNKVDLDERRRELILKAVRDRFEGRK